jgi:NACalpha-BTF3-like transcription factor
MALLGKSLILDTTCFKTSEEYTTAREQELKKRGIEKEAVGSVKDIEAQINDRILALQQPKQTQKSPAYKGVSKSTGQTNYQVKISHNKKQLNIGFYQLESDAAYAYDEAAKLLKGPSWKRNFKANDDYIEAREIEIKQMGVDSDEIEDFDTVCQRIKQRLKKMTKECDTATPKNNGSMLCSFKTTEEYTSAREQELRNRGIEKEAVGSVYDIEKQITDRIIALQQPKQQSSAFKGVCKPTGQSKVHNIGSY